MKFNNRNVTIHDGAVIGKNVKIGDNTVIYENVTIGDNSVVCNDSVIGEPMAAYYTDDTYNNPTCNIGAGSVIRSHTIIYAGCSIGHNFSSGHRITVRENTVIGDNCSIGTLCDIQGDVTIGNYCRLHSNVHISQTSKIGDFVFMYPYSVMTNDPFPPSDDIKGGSIGDYTQVGVHAVVLPGMRIGHNCLIGANAVVSKRIPDYSLAVGDPARVIKDIRDYVVMGKGRPYPWMKRFSRGMPWQDMGYDVWMEQSNKE